MSWFKFRDCDEVVPGSTNISFSSSYLSLGQKADKCKEEVEVGKSALFHAIKNLVSVREARTFTNVRTEARSLLTLVIMIPEAIRFRCIMEHIVSNFVDGKKILPEHCSIVTEWAKASYELLDGKQPIGDSDVDHAKRCVQVLLPRKKRCGSIC